MDLSWILLEIATDVSLKSRDVFTAELKPLLVTVKASSSALFIHIASVTDKIVSQTETRS